MPSSRPVSDDGYSHVGSSVPNNNLIEELSAICHNYRSHGCALTVRRTRVLNLREIRREIRFEAGRDDLRTSNYDPE